MRIIVIDTETTGLDPERCQLLQFSAIYYDTEVDIPMDKRPTFTVLVNNGEWITGEPYAMIMNNWLLEAIHMGINVSTMKPGRVVSKFTWWLSENGYVRGDFKGVSKMEIVVAGKNPSFDLSFLRRLPEWDKNIKVHHRMIDPVTYFTDWDNDVKPPNLQLCLDRAGIDKEVVHDATADARQVAMLIEVMVHDNR